MYNAHFDFSEPPFENNLDQRFFFLSENHKEVLEALLFFVREGKGFALVCGDVGTGKTMLINSFLDQLPSAVKTIVLSNPDAGYLTLLRYIGRHLGVDDPSCSVLELFDAVKDALVKARQEGRRFILIIDEAHLLSNEALEGVRLLSNIETRQEKLLQILLVGQYELSHKLDRVDMRQLRERININRFLSPMDQSETIDYIDHRLRVAGGNYNSCFEANCQKLIYSLTQGVPRRVNLLCDHALLVCASLRLRKVNKDVLKRARDASLSDRILAPKRARGVKGQPGSLFKRLTMVGVCLIALILTAIFIYRVANDAGITKVMSEIRLSDVFVERKVESSDHLSAVAELIKPEKDSGPSGNQFKVPVPPSTKEVLKPAQPQLKAAITRESSVPKGPSDNSNGSRQNPPQPSVDVAGSPEQSADHRANPPQIIGNATEQPKPKNSSLKIDPAIKSEEAGTRVESWTVDSSAGEEYSIKPQETVGESAAVSAPQPSADRARQPLPPQAREHSGPPVEAGPDGPTNHRESQEESSYSPLNSQNRPFQGNSQSPLASSNNGRNLQPQKLRTVKRGDTLMKIASGLAPNNPEDALRRILQLNPSIKDMDRIYPGQVIVLATSEAVDSKPQTTVDGLYYSSYGRFHSWQELQQVMTLLTEQNIKYLVANTPNSADGFSHEVIVGGYETAAALEEALRRLNR